MPENPEQQEPHRLLVRGMAEALAGEQSLNLQEGDIFVVNCDEHGYELYAELEEICQKRGVEIRLADNGIQKVTGELQELRDIVKQYRAGDIMNAKQITDFIEQDTEEIAGVKLYEGANKMIALRGFPGKVNYEEGGIPPDIEEAYEKAAQKNRAVRAGKDNVVIMMPTPDEAEVLGIPYEDYFRQFMEAGANHNWSEYYDAQKHLIERLNQGKELVVTQFDENAPEDWQDMNLTVKLKMKEEDKDMWANSTIRRNYPGGEVFTGPELVTGHFCVYGPMDFNGILLKGIKFRIVDNQVDLHTLDIFEEDETVKENTLKEIIQILNKDTGASGIGELGIGTNNLITGPQVNAVLREKKLGIHLALGDSYSEYNHRPYPDGSDINIDNGNRSENHIDIATTTYRGLTLELDGRILMHDGVFLDETGNPDERLEILSARSD